jgi:hypothetical protein
MNDDCQQIENDDDTCVVIREPVKLTEYDKRRAELRALQDKQEQLLAVPELTPEDRQRLAMLDRQIPEAQKRFDVEAKRGLDDIWRKWRGIQDWRAQSAATGDDKYNKTRRKKRANPNAKLSGWSPEEKTQRKRDQSSDNNWITRRQEWGWLEEQILTALVARIDAREVIRGSVRPPVIDAPTMEQNPNFGKF